MIGLLKKKPTLKKTWTIKKEVLESIMEFSKHSYPNEFAGMLVGDNNVIDDLYVYPAAKNFPQMVIINPNLSPMTLRVIGTVHSHPSGQGVPSRADLSFFRGKKINLVVYYPFDLCCYKAYNKKGELVFLDVI